MLNLKELKTLRAAMRRQVDSKTYHSPEEFVFERDLRDKLSELIAKQEQPKCAIKLKT